MEDTKYELINRITSLLYDFSYKDLSVIYKALWNLAEREESYEGRIDRISKRSHHRNAEAD